ncbi:MerR family transcriptional regulator [Oleidesulfovibrio sp.]|uniref:MerR family transcriptional regulator n=1 Tax=Oleidesulfovibrio sp. TaxID=2909707 RepID=UPI003A84BDD2
MKQQNRYSIGDVSQICNISKKALRYYDKIGLITSQRQDYNNYRYYTQESLLAVPVIKYYKQMGFKLEEMREFIEGNTANVYRAIRNSFLTKIKELEEEQEEIRRKYISVKDWHDLILEAEMVIDNNIQEVSIKYVEPSSYLFLNQHYDANIKAAIINIDFTNFVESLANEITGPVILNFPSHEARMKDKEQDIRIIQKTLMPCTDEHTTIIGGHMMVSCYHIGPHETIGETYKKIRRWARHHGYSIGDESYERYVTDYWTTRNDAKFVTEVMLKASRQTAVISD